MQNTEDFAARGNWRHIDQNSWLRCAEILYTSARCFDLSHPVDPRGPSSPFAQPVEFDYVATQGMPGTAHVGNIERISGGLGQQGTHIDALGHFGRLASAWDGQQPLLTEGITYFGGLTQDEVKPDPLGPIVRLGIDEVPPLITRGVLLDAAALHRVQELRAGFEITAADLKAIMARQGLEEQDVLPGDAVFIHTGWGQRWNDTRHGAYYAAGPGLSTTGAAFLAKFSPSVIGLDNPFTDPVNEGQLQGANLPPGGMKADMPFGTHHLNLVEAGILQIQNMKLSELAQNGVWKFAAIVIPLALRGASGSMVRPVAIGAPTRSVRSE